MISRSAVRKPGLALAPQKGLTSANKPISTSDNALASTLGSASVEGVEPILLLHTLQRTDSHARPREGLSLR